MISRMARLSRTFQSWRCPNSRTNCSGSSSARSSISSMRSWKCLYSNAWSKELTNGIACSTSISAPANCLAIFQNCFCDGGSSLSNLRTKSSSLFILSSTFFCFLFAQSRSSRLESSSPHCLRGWTVSVSQSNSCLSVEIMSSSSSTWSSRKSAWISPVTYLVPCCPEAVFSTLKKKGGAWAVFPCT